MKTILVVDGYNAINAIAETKKLAEKDLLSARSRIIMLTSEYTRSSGYINDFCVVFDGQDKYRHMVGLYPGRSSRQAFSLSGEGDEKIIDTVRSYSSDPGVRVVVASNDNYVRNNSRAYGASLMRSEELSGRRGTKKKGCIRDRGAQMKKYPPPEKRKKINDDYAKELGL